MRRTGQSVWGHPHAAAVFSKRSRNASGSSCGPIFCTGMWVGGAGAVGLSPAWTSRSIQLRNSSRSSRWFWTRAQNLLSWSALMSISALWCSWWSPASDWMTSANGDPVGEDMMAAAFRLPSPGFGNQCNKVRKEADRVGSWRLGWILFTDKLKQVRTLRVLKTLTLSVVSAITLSIRSGCLPLTDRAPESSLRLSPLNSCSTDALFGLSTPITAIRDRCSSFCNWPTYLPLSPESFSRCRLRWIMPPSPQLSYDVFWTSNIGIHRTSLEGYNLVQMYSLWMYFQRLIVSSVISFWHCLYCF